MLVSRGCCAGFVLIHLATRIMHFAAERRLVSVQLSGGIVPSQPTNSKHCQIVEGLVPVSLTCDVFGRPSNQYPGKAHRLMMHGLLSLSW